MSIIDDLLKELKEKGIEVGTYRNKVPYSNLKRRMKHKRKYKKSTKTPIINK